MGALRPAVPSFPELVPRGETGGWLAPKPGTFNSFLTFDRERLACRLRPGAPAGVDIAGLRAMNDLASVFSFSSAFAARIASAFTLASAAAFAVLSASVILAGAAVDGAPPLMDVRPLLARGLGSPRADCLPVASLAFFVRFVLGVAPVFLRFLCFSSSSCLALSSSLLFKVALFFKPPPIVPPPMPD